VLREQRAHQHTVADVAADKPVARIALDRREVAEIARVGKFVEVDNRLIARGEPVQYEVGADKAPP
jgi:hypothetical protein